MFPIFDVTRQKKTDEVLKPGRDAKARTRTKKQREIVEVSSPPHEGETHRGIWHLESQTCQSENLPENPPRSPGEPDQLNTKALHSIFNLPVPSPLQRGPSTNGASTRGRKRKSSSPVIEIFSSSPRDTSTETQTGRDGASKRQQRSTVMEIDLSSRASSSSQSSRAPSLTPIAPIFQKARVPLGTKLKLNPPPSAIPIVIDDDESPGRRECPILLTSPVQPPNRALRLFPRQAPPPADPVPWPTSQSQHVGHVDLGEDINSFIRRRSPRPRVSTMVSEAPFDITTQPLWSVQSSESEVIGSLLKQSATETFEDALLSIPHNHMIIPAFKPVLRSLQADTDDKDRIRETMADRWRPQAANHVLGNESAARYLKAWLRTLELDPESAKTQVSLDSPVAPMEQDTRKRKMQAEHQQSKRPKVVRAVQKPMRKAAKRNRHGYDDDWVVSDEEEEEAFEEASGDRSSEPPLHFRPSVSPRKPSMSLGGPLPEEDEDPPSSYNFDSLTNAILLVGPPGSTKTAAVFACAAELDWDVYEVNSGMGKRSGANLRAIVDGVCKNHVIGTGNSSGPMQPSGPQQTLAEKAKARSLNFFGGRHGKEASLQVGSEEHSTPFGVSRNGPFGQHNLQGVRSNDDAPIGRIGKVKQSLVLLEEVDILFSEDNSFWPAVIELIAASRRPVVMTCNGTTFHGPAVSKLTNSQL